MKIWFDKQPWEGVGYVSPGYRLIDFHARWDRQRRLEPANPVVQGQTRFLVFDENGQRQLPADRVRFTTPGYAHARARCVRTREETV